MLKLTEQESLELLGSVTLGRVVFTQQALPAIRPVNHIVDEEAVIIRSHLGAAIVSQSAGRGGSVVAYEAENLDPVEHLGWSVIVTGTARLVTEPAAVTRYRTMLRPWVDREMDEVISIQVEMITGIRLVDGRPHD
ncbi:pyridoxamine 5'-phosphate oxidase family protein [Nonomuraea sp. NPDC048916]|uniref:pyridoxamine 5'-phosphate oxidase family protein n=1 Tax=Nonomuraea sp. NPDC048916 TaxID=3154232 RepID=UPI0033DA7872